MGTQGPFSLPVCAHLEPRIELCFSQKPRVKHGKDSAALVGSLGGLGSLSGLADAPVSVSGEAKCHPSCSGGVTRRREQGTRNWDHMYIGKDG